jgi:hypothetical protein
MPQYQGVWTLEQQAQAQSNQQWVTDPNFKNTTLLLQADGTGSGSQNQTFLDGSTNNFFITRNGNTTQGSFSPFSQAPGYWGNYFDGSSSYITATSNAAYQFGTGNFTIEFWINHSTPATSTAYPKVFQYADDGNYSSGGYGAVFTTSTTTFTFTAAGGTPSINATVNAYSWNHVAIVRNSSVTTIYVNGIAAASAADTGNYNYAGTYPFAIGSGRNGAGNYSAALTGYISNFRVVKGTAVYTSAFTPQTTPFTAISGTSLLTCQNNRFIDNSTNAFTITANGTPSVQAFGPFAPALQWTPDVVGGSGYFDGSGDYLSIADNSAFALGSGDFTIECWAYTQAWASQYNVLICQWNSGTAFIFRITASLVGLYVNIGGTQDKNVAVTNSLNTWDHFCVTRSGSTLTFYKNGASIGTAAISGTISDPTDNITIGLLGDLNSTTAHTGYISGLRLIKGTAVAPTITAPPTAITNTSLLLNYTNAGIYDGKMANNLETVGSAQVATSPVKYGSGSMYFNGSTSYLTRPYSPLFAFGNGNFTVECWINTTQNGGANYPSVVGRWSGGNSWDLRHSAGDNSGKPTFAYNDGTSNFNVASTGSTVYDGQWHHLAAVRNNNIITLYVDGISVGTSTFTGTIAAATSTPLTVGSTSGGGIYYTGYIDDLRITVGVARYFTNFTPPQQALPRQ